MRKFLKFSLKFTALACLALIVSFFILDKIFPLDYAALKREQAKILYDANGEIINAKLAADGIWRFDANASEIPEILKKSVLAFEDRYFYYHLGVNPFSIARAAIYNARNANRVGASTITMQVARMMSPQGRTYGNKIKEIFRALQLEAHFSKDEILNFYFNLAPYGGNIEGIRAASRFYFGREPSELSIAQTALLSTIPKNPNKNRLDKKSDVNRLKNRVVKLLYRAGVIDLSAFKRAQAEPFKNVRISAPQNAPEFSRVAFKNGVSRSNLDLTLQNDLLNALNSAMVKLRDKNANNAAGVVIDNEKMSVVAFVGSHDANAKDGLNSALYMRRNAGSTLKPFIFSLALEDGLITPKTRVIDTQIFINEYAPKNYDEGYLGIVSAADALKFSLNIPAVNLNSKLGDNGLYELLTKANLTSETKEFYGASIALGSVELSLLNIAHLYTIYANDGILRPLEFAGELVNRQDENLSLISPQSAFLTAKILSEANRAYLKNAWQYARNTPKIAFKTGTSYGARDIYAIGVNKNFTVAVWAGNFNASKTQNLTGLNDASKIVFDVFKILAQRRNLEFMSEPAGIKTTLTCLDPYELKSCKILRNDEQILGVELKSKCENIRGEELDFLYKNKILSASELAASPCAESLKSKKPLIARPYANETLVTNENSSKVAIKCFPYLGDEIFIKVDDGEFEKLVGGEEILKELPLGEHKIGCLDGNSNLNEIKITIRR